MGRHTIDLALDLARMPALTRSSVTPPVPANVIELMRIAAAVPTACQDAVAATGEPVDVLVEAARFYLQQVLFRPGADCYRILGIHPGAPRVTARSHMRLLLQWLHPDRNDGLETVYAERVVKAWREVSAASKSTAGAEVPRTTPSNLATASIRLPWIKLAHPRSAVQSYYRGLALWLIPAGVAIIFLALWSAAHYFNSDQAAAMITRMP